MSLENKLKDSKLSLEGNGFNPTPTIPSWGFENPNIIAPTLNPLNPKLSALQNTYSVDTIPAKVKIVSFNKTQYEFHDIVFLKNKFKPLTNLFEEKINF